MAADPKIAFNAEVQLLRWSDTSNGGATITLALADHADLEIFKLMTIKKGQQAGQRLACVMVEIGDDEQAVEQPAVAGHPHGGYGKSYQIIFRLGWPNNPRVKAALKLDTAATAVQVKDHLHRVFDVASLGEVPPADFIEFARKLGVADTLPREFGE